ncbi:unnamed protein product, partial [Cyprideis torosa]
MALLGFQVVLTMIGASCLQKLGPLNSFAKWMLGSTGLVRFLPPTDTELRRHVKLPKELLKREKKKEKNGTVAVDTFSVPRSIDVQLDAVKVVPMELLQLKFYSEYQWLLDFSICTLIIYGISEVYYYLVPASTEANLSVVWVALVIGFCVKILFSLTKLYFIGGEDSSGERSLCFLAGFFFLLVGMVVLVVDESLLELSLEPALEAFKDNAGHFLKQQGVQSREIKETCLRGSLGRCIFLFETSGRSSLLSHEVCAIESAANLHPDWTLFVLTHQPLKLLPKVPNVRFALLDAEEFLKDSLVHNWWVNFGKSETPHFFKHVSDVAKYLLLYEYGGMAMDLN